MKSYPLLFSPLKINQMELRNRIVLPAMHLNYTPTGKVTDQLVEFYRERALGGAGLIIVGGCMIGPLAGGPIFVSLKDDSDLEGLGRLASVVHDGGSLIGAQLYHAGAYAHQALIGGKSISSSVHVSGFTREEARALTLEEIPLVQDEFASAAKRAQAAGFDMVEILGSAGYLICQFLSPRINQREDEYGGSLENRMRFGLETIAKVRAAVGPDFCVGIRIAGNDFVPGSHTGVEAAQFAAACAQAGVDLINVTGGWHETKVPQITGDLPPAGLSYLARNVRRAVKVPVAASNRINQPLLAEQILARGDADLVCLGRPLLADPEFPAKAARGRADLIRPCVACNQGCFDAIPRLQPVGCMLNPRAGREAKVPAELPAADQPGLVAVVGGGPAGCQAALTAARRGHRVLLWEEGPALGGQTLWYARPTHKPEFARIGPYFSAALAEAGVEVRLGQRVSAAEVAGAKPQTVVVATGGRPSFPALPGAERPFVTGAWEVLQGKVLPQGQVVVIGGGAVGLETALYVAGMGALTPEQLHFLTLFQAEDPETLSRLVAQGSHKVTVLELLPKVGTGIGRSTRWIVFGRIKRFGVQVRTKVEVLAIEADGVRCRQEGQEELIPAQTVILATGMRAQDELAQELSAQGLAVKVIGDAAGAGSVLDSIAQGFKVGMEI